MSDKVLYEFRSRLSRAKNSYDSAKNQNNALKKEAIFLETKLEKLKKQKEIAENREKKAIDQYTNTYYSRKNENEKTMKDEIEMNKLREIKKSLKNKKEIVDSEMHSFSLKLQRELNLRKKEEKLQEETLEKLELVLAEKYVLESELENKNIAIEKISQELKDEKDDLEKIKNFISKNC